MTGLTVAGDEPSGSATKICLVYNSVDHCVPNLFGRRPLLASKNKHGSSHHYSRQYTVSGDRYPQLKICISQLISDSYGYMPVAYVTMHCMI